MGNGIRRLARVEPRPVKTTAEVRNWPCLVRVECVDKIRPEVGRYLPPKWELVYNHLRVFGS